jgi:DNA modification methylase
VLDPFIATGTTALAAEKHGRDWLGIELNPAYAEIAEERFRNLQTRAFCRITRMYRLGGRAVRGWHRR